jgi:hypothetical protein
MEGKQHLVLNIPPDQGQIYGAAGAPWRISKGCVTSLRGVKMAKGRDSTPQPGF